MDFLQGRHDSSLWKMPPKQTGVKAELGTADRESSLCKRSAQNSFYVESFQRSNQGFYLACGNGWGGGPRDPGAGRSRAGARQGSVFCPRVA